MPFSQSSQLSAILGYAEELKPTSVLDLGTGMGQYGFMLRNNLEFLNLFEIDAGGGDCGRASNGASKLMGLRAVRHI